MNDKLDLKTETPTFGNVLLAPVRVLNLYAGIGGNRKHWKNVEVTAIEYNEEIANVYKQLHPKDNVIVTDAHDYLAKHWREFDFIWSSPPCQSHSKVRMMASKSGSYDAVMPDMKLWSEIIFLQNFTKNTDIKFVVENVKPYYEPFVKPNVILGRHPFWTNIDVTDKEFKNIDISRSKPEELLIERGIDATIFDCIKDVPENRSKDNRFERLQLVRNMVNPEIGLHILKCAGW